MRRSKRIDWIYNFKKERIYCPYCDSNDAHLKPNQFWRDKNGDFVLCNKLVPVSFFCNTCYGDFKVSIEKCCKEFKRKTVSFDPNRTTIEEDLMNALIGD